MLNSVTLVGRIASDITLRYTPSGRPVAQFRLAVERPGRGKEDRKTDFIPVVTWGAGAEAAARYLQKGRLAAVRGRLQIREYTDRQGARRWATEVVGFVTFLPDGKNGNGGSHQQDAAPQTATPAQAETPEHDILPVPDELELTPEDEDVPF